MTNQEDQWIKQLSCGDIGLEKNTLIVWVWHWSRSSLSLMACTVMVCKVVHLGLRRQESTPPEALSFFPCLYLTVDLRLSQNVIICFSPLGTNHTNKLEAIKVFHLFSFENFWACNPHRVFKFKNTNWSSLFIFSCFYWQ